MTQPGTYAQCGRSCDPDYRLCDECREAEDDALQNHRAQCGRSAPPDDRLCDRLGPWQRFLVEYVPRGRSTSVSASNYRYGSVVGVR